MEAELNKWINMKDALLGWYAEFPFIEDKAQAESYLPYIEKVLEIGEETKVLKVIGSSLGKQYGAPNIPYVEQVKWVLEHKQTFIFLSELITSSYVAYFDFDGTVSCEYISSAKALIEGLRPNGVSAKRDYPPLDLSGYGEYFDSIAVEHVTDFRTQRKIDTTLIWFSLYSDIWFPYVIDWYRWYYRNEEDRPPEEFLFDNRTLATEHTPRLNAFLEEVKALTIQFGGNWKTSQPDLPVYDVYGQMQTDTGIRLRNDFR
jgi:hypothetical protein